ncbi:MAG: Ig-like domain-containing protein [Polyangiaceae bacterium]|nr:Ig-like domain-containing protein [Polyangiaceae bacterium]
MSSSTVATRARHLLLGVVALTSAAAFGVHCASSTKPPVSEAPSTITVSPSAKKIAADGTTIDLSITASGAAGAGTGTVELEVTKGSLGGGTDVITLELANGRAATTWSCNEKLIPGCTGKQTVTAKWTTTTSTANVEFTGATVVDGGVDAGPTQTLIGLSADRPKIYAMVGDSTNVTASVRNKLDAGLVNEPVRFATNFGLLTSADAGLDSGAPVGTSLDLSTGPGGRAAVSLHELNAVGVANISVTRTATGESAQLDVPIVGIQDLTWSGTKCLGQNCTIMGVKDSGFNETALVTFKLVSANNEPVRGVNVGFSLSTPPFGTTVSPSGTTDAQGVVTATVSSGPSIGTFAVIATVNGISGQLVVNSPSIGIRGATPSNNGFSLQCTPTNLAAYVAPSPPLPLETTCTVTLVDRFNNPVGSGNSVNFKSEAGTVPTTVATQAFAVGGDNSKEGRGTFKFSTVGKWPALDVPPLAAAPGQFPGARAVEPSVADGLLTRNPRDGLVTILAYIQGEEYFQDSNANGTRDVGESFIDQGEPFVDENDNGVYDLGELYIDVAPTNGSWDGPNGQWDKNTTIWTEARVLYTGRPSAANSFGIPSSFAASDIPRGGNLPIAAVFRDLNLNGPQAGSTFSASYVGARGTLSGVNPTTALDGFGFAWERRKVSAADDGECNAATPICKWKVLFYSWSGFGASATLTNSTSTSPDGGVGTASLKATVLSEITTVEVSGPVL